MLKSGDPTMSEKGDSIVRQDPRENIVRGIDFLVAMLAPHFDDEMKTNEVNFSKHVLFLKKQLFINTINYIASIQSNGNREKYAHIRNYYLKNKLNFIDKTSPVYEVYISEKFDLYMEMFRDLNFLLERIDWLSTVDYVDG